MKKNFDTYRKKRGIPSLLPVQEEVLSREDLFDPSKNVIIVSPTSSGKSLIVEHFIASALSNGKKVVYLSPLKSLIEEKEEDFKFVTNFFDATLRISTHERRSEDSYIFKGNYDILLTVYEKFAYFLQKNRIFLRNIGLLIFDELTILEDPVRGPYIDIILSYVKKRGVKILITTSYISSPHRLARHIGATLISSFKRSTPLHIGYVEDGIFYWREEEGSSIKSERLLNKRYSQDEEFFLLLERFWKEDGAIIFFPTRSKARMAFSYLGERFPTIWHDIDVENLPNTLFSKNIHKYVSRGIGYHSRDLTYKERKFIERLTAKGKIKLLFATTTLAFGVNMPFRNVIFPESFFISKGFLENMIGRAARGKRFTYGRAIFFDKFHIECKKEKTQKIELRNIHEVYTFLLRSIVFGIKEEELYFKYNGEIDKEKGTLFLQEEGLIKREAQNMAPTILGRFIAVSGVDIASFLKIKEVLLNKDVTSIDDFIFRFMDVTTLHKFYLDPMPYNLYLNWWEKIAKIFPHFSLGHLTEKDIDHIRKTFIILDFIHKEELSDMEERYRLTAGIITEFLDRFIWLIEIAYSLINYIPIPHYKVEIIRELESSLVDTESRYVLYIEKDRPDTVIFYGRRVDLTHKQFELLKLLAKNPGKVYTYDEILSNIWKDNYDISLKQISYHKGELTKKMGRGDIIKTIKGRGLCLNLSSNEVRVDV